MQLRPGAPEEVGMSATRIRYVADLARGWVAEGMTPALVVLVARRGVIVLHEAFGRLTPEVDAPLLSKDAIFPLASISKPVTATAAMILVEEGRLGLNRPVVEYIPELTGEGKEAILVHHLLTHTSGLREEDLWSHIEQKYVAGVELPPPAATQHPLLNLWLTYGYDTPLWKQPGVEMSYCNYGYELLGEIIRRVSGQSIHDFASDRIFTPLGMKDTSYVLPERLADRVVKRPATAFAAGPEWNEWSSFPTSAQAIYSGFNSRALQELPGGSTGVYSTAQDMAIFGQMFLNDGRYGNQRILSPVSVAAMTRNQIPGIGSTHDGQHFPEASWGFGWDVHGGKKAQYDGALCSPQAYSHSGSGGVQFWVDPLYELVGVYFSVVLRTTPDGLHPVWPVDHFMDAVTAAIIE